MITFGRILTFIVITGAAYAATQIGEMLQRDPHDGLIAGAIEPPAPSLVAPLPGAGVGVLESLELRSPFDPAHARYYRDAQALPARQSIVLIGIFTQDGERRATVRLDPGGEQFTVSAGDQIGDALISSVERSRLTLIENGETRVVQLFSE